MNFYAFQSNESFDFENDKRNFSEDNSNNLESKTHKTTFSKHNLIELNDLNSLKKQLEVFDGCALKKLQLI